MYGYKVVKTYPHDPNAFTQGLIFDEFLYEGTGKHAKSTLRKTELETGRVLGMRRLPARYFGEGITVWKEKLIQLTWRSRIGFIYDKESFRLLGRFTYPTEGWGITHDDRNLIMSDGTATLYFLDPETFKEARRIEVCDDKSPVSKLNELEYIKGAIYANIWKTNRIAKISPESGRVTGWIELDGLLNEVPRAQPIDVLNGIAYDQKRDRIFVTGKYWPVLFEILIAAKR